MLTTSHFAVKKFYSVSAYKLGPQGIWSAAPGLARNRVRQRGPQRPNLLRKEWRSACPRLLGVPQFPAQFSSPESAPSCGSTPQRAQCPGRLGNVAFAAVLENGQECRPGFAPRARATLTRCVENHQSSHSRARPTSARLGRLDLPPDLCPTVPAPTSIGINHERVARKWISIILQKQAVKRGQSK